MKLKLIYITCLAFSITAVQAQKKAVQDTALNKQMVLEREYAPVFRDASRIDQLPQITEPKISKSPIGYQFNMLNTKAPMQWDTIQPEKKMGQPGFIDQKGYANFGIGLPSNTYGNAGITLFEDAENKFSVTFDHRLNNDERKIKQINEKQTFFSTDNALQGNYSHESEKSVLNFASGYKHSAFNYLGAPADSAITAEDSLPISHKHQVQNQFYIGGNIHSLEGASTEYSAGIRYGYFGKKLNALDSIKGIKEHYILLNGEISGKFLDNSRIGAGFALNNFIYSKDNSLEIEDEQFNPENYGLMEFAPHYDLEGENYNVRLGFKSQFRFANKNKVYIAPSISGIWEFAPRFYLNGEIGGGSKIYSFEQTDNEYRYLNPSMRLKDTFTPFDATVSIRTNALPMFGFELQTGYKSGEEYYMTSGQTGNRVNVLTPHLSKIKQFKVGLLAQFNYEKIADLQLKIMKYSYKAEPEDSLNTGIKAWYKPDMEISLDGDFHLNDKLTMQLNYYLATGRYALVNDETVKLDPINNLSVGGRYALTQKLSAFAQMNNILFQKYDMWYGMPAQNFNFVAGVGITF